MPKKQAQSCALLVTINSSARSKTADFSEQWSTLLAALIINSPKSCALAEIVSNLLPACACVKVIRLRSTSTLSVVGSMVAHAATCWIRPQQTTWRIFLAVKPVFLLLPPTAMWQNSTRQSAPTTSPTARWTPPWKPSFLEAKKQVWAIRFWRAKTRLSTMTTPQRVPVLTTERCLPSPELPRTAVSPPATRQPVRNCACQLTTYATMCS